jgi:cobaltochelatase CobN
MIYLINQFFTQEKLSGGGNKLIFTIVTVSTSSINTLVSVYRKHEELFRDKLDLRLYYAARTISIKQMDEMERSLNESDMILVDLMGSPEPIIKRVDECLKKSEANIIPYGRSGRAFMKLGDFKSDAMKGKKKPDMKAMKQMSQMAEKMGKLMPGKMKDMMNLSAITKYFSLADESNIRNMLFLILTDYGGYKSLPKFEKPITIPSIGICNPKTRSYSNPERYHVDSDRQKVAVFFYGHTYPNDTAGCVDQFCERINEFANVLPIAFSSPSPEDFDELENILKNHSIDLVVNFMSFRLSAGPMGGDAEKAISLLETLDVPYFHPFFMSRRKESEWLDSKQGVSTSEFTISVMMSEFDGAIETMPIAAMDEPIFDEMFHIEIKNLKIIEDRLEKCVKRIENQLSLRAKTNSEKRLAIICYDYPPGEANVFGGAFLDTFKSIEKLLLDLEQEGYQVETKTAEEMIQAFTEGGLGNSCRYHTSDQMIKYSRQEFSEYFRSNMYYDEVNEQWENSYVMMDENDLYVPGLDLGHVFVGLQPSRGIHEHVEKIYHDKDLLPHEQYFAFYHWLEHVYKADAVIHVGTHGTLEFNMGKECGMSKSCIPDHLVGNMPHMYLYYASNPSEAMIAKRRSHANLIGYQPSDFIPGQLYGDFIAIGEMIDEYRETALKAPARSNEIMADIKALASERHLPEELDELEHELYRMDQSLIPNGLHTFGIPYNADEAFNYTLGVLRQDQGQILSLPKLIAKSKGLDYEELLENGDYDTLKTLSKSSSEIFSIYLKGQTFEGYNETLKYGKRLYDTCQTNHETLNLMKSLSGKYNKAKLAGDIYRSPEVMPTGYNLYQFDPRKVPSQTAMKRGEQIANNTIEVYTRDHGEPPKSTAVVLWGLETSRTQGETIGQILTYWGVRVKRTQYQWSSNYEITPLEELGRPRIDVTINICGFFRDMFPNLIEDLNKLSTHLSMLDEPETMNFLKQNSKKNLEILMAESMDTDIAKELSTARIFGPPEGEYGTGITSIIETKNWIDEAVFGESFTDRMQHIYTENHRGKKAKKLYERNLNSVQMVSQLRSNNEYEVTDLDHYYEFFGGLSKAVEQVRGEKVKIYISDTTSEKIETEIVSKSISRGIRTRLLNPKWIDGMLRHEFHGAQEIAERFENVMGLAATTGEVESWIYDRMHETYVADQDMVERMKKNNKYAYIDVLEHLLEYEKRGYWEASEEQLNQIKQVYLSVEGDIEEHIN